MKLKLSDPSKTEAVVKRAFMLAYCAAGSASGMGFFQAKSSATEDEIWSNVCARGDYPGAVVRAQDDLRQGKAYGDYVFGRMMKLRIEFDRKDGTISVPDSQPRRDYQGWTCQEFPSYQSLVEMAATEIGVDLSVA